MITEEYIEKCKKAEEIQKNWKPKAWDWVAVPKEYDIWNEGMKVGKYSILVLSGYETDCFYYGPDAGIFDPDLDIEEICPSQAEFKKHAIWLPSQEQMENMLGGDVSEVLQELYDFYFYKNPRFTFEDEFESIADIYLACIMYKKYHKIWDKKLRMWR